MGGVQFSDKLAMNARSPKSLANASSLSEMIPLDVYNWSPMKSSL